MKAHVIENGIVVNTIEVESLDFMPGLVEATEGGIGWAYSNGILSAPHVDPIEVDYRAQRAAEYPPMADYIDGIVKGDQSQVQAYIDACLAVKAKYPKPAP
jgi:hypothetical protein